MAKQDTIHLWIGNQEVTSAIKFAVVNAETGKVVHDAYGATPDIAVQAVESAEEAFWKWRDTDPWYRRKLLLDAANYLESKRDEVSALIAVRWEYSLDMFCCR
jgi:acyl-CoA reductase-like NAD-dependent aldehyde dehydrogenase